MPGSLALGGAWQPSRRLLVPPDGMGVVRPGRDADAAGIWKTASRVHFNLDFRLNSQRLAACLTPAKAIGGRAWPSVRVPEPDWEEALAAWANTTLGLLKFWWEGSPPAFGARGHHRQPVAGPPRVRPAGARPGAARRNEGGLRRRPRPGVPDRAPWRRGPGAPGTGPAGPPGSAGLRRRRDGTGGAAPAEVARRTTVHGGKGASAPLPGSAPARPAAASIRSRVRTKAAPGNGSGLDA